MAIRVVTDSTCDLPKELLERYDITVVPLYINVDQESYLDGIELSRQEFYERLPNYQSSPTTATPGPAQFIQVYDRLAAEGATEILSIHISARLSAVVDVARSAARETRSVPVTVLDSRQISLGTGMLVVTAAKAAAEGCSMLEILALLEEQISRTHVIAVLDTVEYLRRSGRMNGAIAGLASMVQVKPLLRMHDGKPTSELIRTASRAAKRILELVNSLAPLEQLALVHAHASEKARMFLEEIRHLWPANEIVSVEIAPVLGAHIGPGAVGFACITARDRLGLSG